jgi:hypothetical protein
LGSRVDRAFFLFCVPAGLRNDVVRFANLGETRWKFPTVRFAVPRPDGEIIVEEQ